MRGRRRAPRETLRTCIGCRRRAAPEALVRLAVAGDRIVVSRTRAGRGAWLCPEAACLERAWRSKAFARALRQPVEVDVVQLDGALAAGNSVQQVCEDRGRGGAAASRRGSGVEAPGRDDRAVGKEDPGL